MVYTVVCLGILKKMRQCLDVDRYKTYQFYDHPYQLTTTLYSKFFFYCTLSDWISEGEIKIKEVKKGKIIEGGEVLYKTETRTCEVGIVLMNKGTDERTKSV